MSEDPLRTTERVIVQALRETLPPGHFQSQVTRSDGFDIATDDVIVRVTRNPDADWHRRMREENAR